MNVYSVKKNDVIECHYVECHCKGTRELQAYQKFFVVSDVLEFR